MALMTDAYLLQLVWVALIVIAAVIFAINAIMRYVKRISEKKNLPINVHRQNPMCVAAVRPDAVEVAPVRNDGVIVSLWFIGEN